MVTNETRRIRLRAKWTRAYHRKRDAILVRRKAYRDANPERVRRIRNESQRRTWPKRQAYLRKYYESHKEQIKEKAKRHYEDNKQVHFEYTRKRKALKAKSAVNLKSILRWMRSVKSRTTARCYYCDKKISTAAIHFDHVIPLVKGGPHSVENLCVSCPRCNLTKNKSLISEWFKAGQQILGL